MHWLFWLACSHSHGSRNSHSAVDISVTVNKYLFHLFHSRSRKAMCRCEGIFANTKLFVFLSIYLWIEWLASVKEMKRKWVTRKDQMFSFTGLRTKSSICLFRIPVLFWSPATISSKWDKSSIAWKTDVLYWAYTELFRWVIWWWLVWDSYYIPCTAYCVCGIDWVLGNQSCLLEILAVPEICSATTSCELPKDRHCCQALL